MPSAGKHATCETHRLVQSAGKHATCETHHLVPSAGKHATCETHHLVPSAGKHATCETHHLVPSAGKHATCETHHLVQSAGKHATCETHHLVQSTGKHKTFTKRGETCKRCQVKRNARPVLGLATRCPATFRQLLVFWATFIILGNFFNFEQLLVKKRVFLIFCCEKLCIWQINHRKYVLLKISLQVSLKNILFDPIFHDKTMK